MATIIMKRGSWIAAALVAVLLLPISPNAGAQEGKSSREREALRRTQQALRAAQEASSNLQRDKDRLAQEKDALVKDKERSATEVRQTASRLDAALAQGRHAQSRIQALEAELASVNQALASERDARAKLAEQLAESRQLVATTRAMLERSTQAQRILAARNQQLYQVGSAVVEMYRSRKPSETLARQEPFFNLGVVTLENISDTWQDRLEAARFWDQEKLSQ